MGEWWVGQEGKDKQDGIVETELRADNCLNFTCCVTIYKLIASLSLSS